jgi:L-fuculose-phosphate aldolase
MKAYSQPSALFHNALGTYTDSIALIRNPEMGARVAQALGRHRAALLKSHGVVVAAQSVEEAVVSAIMLESSAMIQMIVETAGEPAREFPPEDIEILKHQLSRVA